MSKGYLVMAQGEKYARQSEHLAHSIRNTQSGVSRLSVITDQDVDCTLFDKVISIDEDLAANSKWKIENRVKFYNLTPYEETVILDADMLFLSDVSHWWKMFEKYDLLLTSKVLTYRGMKIINSPYRKTFIHNQLPDVYSAFTYFKKSKITAEFFELVKHIVANWKDWTVRYSPEYSQKFPSIDVAMAIAVKILDIESQVISKFSYPTFTHMKDNCQGLATSNNKWTRVLGAYKGAASFKIGAFPQTGILHYVEKDFI